MSPRPAKVTQAEIARALRAVAQSGLQMTVEVLPCGTVRMTPAGLCQTQPRQRRDVEYYGEIKL